MPHQIPVLKTAISVFNSGGGWIINDCSSVLSTETNVCAYFVFKVTVI